MLCRALVAAAPFLMSSLSHECHVERCLLTRPLGEDYPKLSDAVVAVLQDNEVAEVKLSAAVVAYLCLQRCCVEP